MLLDPGAVSTGEVSNLKIVPAGLYYTSKTKFRSSALLYFGQPIEVIPVQLEPDGNPPRPAVRELSSQVAAALRSVILDAEHEEALTDRPVVESSRRSETHASASTRITQ